VDRAGVPAVLAGARDAFGAAAARAGGGGIGHSWRHLATFGVLSAWTIAGLVLAPVVLRRMARRESGSNVAARREKAMRDEQ
jgi:hypothetical protein